MKKSGMVLFLCVLSLLNCVPSGAEGVDHVVIVSIDGGKPRSLEQSKMPNLKRLVDEGASTFRAETISPSITLPSHVSMLTGVRPEIHKITWNSWKPWIGPVKIPTVFGVARAQSRSTALFASKEKFRHLEVKDSLDKFSFESIDARNVSKEAIEYLKKNKPNLLFIHMPDADVAGHIFGWESIAQLKALENVDEAIGKVMRALQETFPEGKYALIVTADHGGSGWSHGSDSDDDRIIPWIAWGSAKKSYSISKNVSTVDTAATALWLLGVPVPQGWEGVPVEEAFQ